MSDQAYEIRETTALARQLAGVRAQVPRGRVGEFFGRYLDAVYSAGKAGSVKLDGQNVFIYRGAEGGMLTVDFCIGITEPFSGAGEVLPLDTPTGIAVMTTHVGDYRRLGDANAAIVAWCKANGRELSGPSWEVYGHWSNNPTELKTEVWYLLRA